MWLPDMNQSEALLQQLHVIAQPVRAEGARWGGLELTAAASGVIRFTENSDCSNNVHKDVLHCRDSLLSSSSQTLIVYHQIVLRRTLLWMWDELQGSLCSPELWSTRDMFKEANHIFDHCIFNMADFPPEMIQHHLVLVLTDVFSPLLV